MNECNQQSHHISPIDDSGIIFKVCACNRRGRGEPKREEEEEVKPDGNFNSHWKIISFLLFNYLFFSPAITTSLALYSSLSGCLCKLIYIFSLFLCRCTLTPAATTNVVNVITNFYLFLALFWNFSASRLSARSRERGWHNDIWDDTDFSDWL